MAAKEPEYSHRFRYPIHELKKGETVLGTYSELAVHETLVQYGYGDNDPFLRYAIYLGEGSGLHTAIPEWADRKKEAARLAGIPPTHPRYEGMMNLSDDGTQELRWAWMKLMCSRKYRAYVALSEAYDQNCRKVETPIIEVGASPAMPDMDADQQALLKMFVKPGSNTELKEDGVQRAYKLRSELAMGLSLLEEKLCALETGLFFGDEHMRQAAIEAARPQAEKGSIEDKIFKRQSR